MPTPVRFKDSSEDELLGLALPYGGPFLNSKGMPSDLHGEYFSESTELCLDWFPSRPLLYAHGRDDEAGTSVVGRVTSWDKQADGVWAQMILDRSSDFYATLRELIKAGKLHLSSGAMAHLVETDKTSGEITQWPWVELSLTEQPANLLARLSQADAERHFKEAGISWRVPGLKAITDEDKRIIKSETSKQNMTDLVASHRRLHQFAAQGHLLTNFTKADMEWYHSTVEAELQKRAKDDDRKPSDPSPLEWKSANDEDLKEAEQTDESVKHLAPQVRKIGARKKSSSKALPSVQTPVDGDMLGMPPAGSYEALACQLQRALAQLLMEECVCVVATYPDYFVAMAGDYRDTAYYEVSYSMGPSGMPVLGEMREVERVYAPLPEIPSQTAPMAVASARLIEMTTLFGERTKDLAERRAKAGRVISDASKKRIQAAIDAMSAVMADLHDLMAGNPSASKDADLSWTLAKLGALKAQYDVLLAS